MTRRLLLASNSTMYGRGYLDHCAGAIRRFLDGIDRVLFVPWALHDAGDYAAKARSRLGTMGFECVSIHESDPVRAVQEAGAVFIGGGNTFRLLDRLHGSGILPLIRRRVEEGMPYVGSSAGTNVACVSIRTTNDMPIVEPPSFEALALVPFNINPHYVDADPNSTLMGETREERIRQFHEENDPPVLAMREGAWLHVEGTTARLEGSTGRLFRKNRDPEELESGAILDALLA